MADFKVDTDAFQNAITKYNSELESIKKVKVNIDSILSNLKNNGWNSSAGEAFLKEFEVSCTENINKYIEIAEILKNVLSHAGTEFDKLATEISKLECKY